MRSYLSDIITHALCGIDLVKVTGTDDATVIDSISGDRNVILSAAFNEAQKEFKGTFGMPNLGKLSVILGTPEYKENANIAVTYDNRDGNEIATGIHFENATGDFVNDYRFMNEAAVNAVMRSAKLKNQPKWDVTFEPSMAAIQRFSYQQACNAEEAVFTAKNVNGDLVFEFGDHSTHSAKFIFQPGAGANIARAWAWNIKTFIAILGSAGDKTVSFSSSEGLAGISVNSGLITYNYLLPANIK